ncbi:MULTISPECIES: SCP2 sterol-binding domain-containing protein [Idiomarina]|uniref:ubiquinone anaerobic biosynthesis accessory factor UbiT n=1 Tax=Idiomarina TaxID=135575 RepID=UPI000C5A6134|nr:MULTISPECIES: SCP2 sterol-binding domain-containing protein [Idiomarina]MAO68866.1 lipid carrier protein [Idiomarina sp.]MBF81086.1 lipid carrier protein [Idiomarina sp.]
MNTTNWVSSIPKIIQPINKLIPERIINFGSEQLLNRLFKEEIISGDLDFISERVIEIKVKDIDLSLFLTLKENQLKTLKSPVKADVQLSADGDALLLLIYGKVDPDTLFFNRKLMVKGNTELGLHLKNFLDTIEVNQKLPKALFLIGDRFSDFIYKEKDETIQIS